MRAYGVRGLPTTFLIDLAGDALVREIGEQDLKSEGNQMMVEELLQKPGAAEKR